jgi:hypothetical protein
VFHSVSPLIELDLGGSGAGVFVEFVLGDVLTTSPAPVHSVQQPMSAADPVCHRFVTGLSGFCNLFDFTLCRTGDSCEDDQSS